uniref:DHC_N1 domain-containing protein n=1 Tax=Panagrellus redivivus TaxID=6233 RepID=A0A7E4VHL8_PANRE
MEYPPPIARPLSELLLNCVPFWCDEDEIDPPVTVEPSPSVATQEPLFLTQKYYLIDYTLPDFHALLQLMKKELTFESLESTQTAPDATWSTQSRILVKVDTLLDQIIMLWKGHAKRNKLDVSKSVHTVFEAKYEVEQLIREIGDIFTKAISTSKQHSANVLKKKVDAKIYLVMSICKSIMDDIIDALVPNYNAFNGNEYNQFFELITKDF